MKTIKRITLVLGIGVMSTVLSCSEDDIVSLLDIGNQVTFDGTTYTMTNGVVSDYGAGYPLDGAEADSHWNFDFTISDAAFQEYQDGTDTYLGAGPSATIVIYIELFSPGTSGFQAGTFSFINDDTASPSDIDGEFFFSSGEVELDNDGVENGDLDGPEYEITGGSVTVVGSGNTDYTITYNLTTSGGKTVTGTFSGPFQFEADND